MKVWSRDKYIEVVLQKLKVLDSPDVLSMRHRVGKILSLGLPTLGNPFSYVDEPDDFDSALTSIFARTSINDIDVATSLVISNFKKSDKNSSEHLAMESAAAFLKSTANIATARKKRKSPNKDKLALYEFFAKIALNSMIEFNASDERTSNAH